MGGDNEPQRAVLALLNKTKKKNKPEITTAPFPDEDR